MPDINKIIIHKSLRKACLSRQIVFLSIILFVFDSVGLIKHAISEIYFNISPAQ